MKAERRERLHDDPYALPKDVSIYDEIQTFFLDRNVTTISYGSEPQSRLLKTPFLVDVDFRIKY